jgi:hypothetical protein
MSDLDVGALPEVKATVAVQNKATGQQVVRRDVMVPHESTEVVIGEPGPGSYLVTVTGPAGAAAVSDIFAVASPGDVEG